MNILSKILGKIFPAFHPAHASAAAPSPGRPSPEPTPTPAPVSNSTTTDIPAVDVAVILDGVAQKKEEKLNWRTSIVDLLKLLDIDSSLQARKELAQELNYQGDNNDSANMNIWLHKQVMKKLAENGGKVPDDLKD